MKILISCFNPRRKESECPGSVGGGGAEDFVLRFDGEERTRFVQKSGRNFQADAVGLTK